MPWYTSGEFRGQLVSPEIELKPSGLKTHPSVANLSHSCFHFEMGLPNLHRMITVLRSPASAFLVLRLAGSPPCLAPSLPPYPASCKGLWDLEVALSCDWAEGLMSLPTNQVRISFA